jgi:hypothetical protein
MICKNNPFTSVIRILTGNLCVSATILRCLQIVTSYLVRKKRGQSGKKIDMSKKLPPPFRDTYECLQVVTSYQRIFMSDLRMLAIDYESEIRKTRKGNP